jgi:hypothetical protein
VTETDDKAPTGNAFALRPRIPEEILRRRPRRLRHRGAWAMVRGQLKRSSVLLALLLGFLWGGLTLAVPLLAAPNANPYLVAGIVGAYVLLFAAALFATVMWNFRRVLERLRIAQFGTPSAVTVVKTSRGQTDWLTYKDAQGKLTRVEVSRLIMAQYVEGDPLTELTDTRSGKTFVPEAFEIEFEPISDIRTTDLPPAQLTDVAQSGRTRVYATPLPEETGVLARMVDPNPVQKCGKLHWDDELLTLESEQGTTQLRWDRPWSVALGAAPVTGEHTELHLRLRERNAGAGAGSIELTTQLPQRQVSRQVPDQEARYAFVPTKTFQKLLPTLLLHAQATGDTELARLLTTAHNAPQSLPAAEKVEADKQVEVVARRGRAGGRY